MAMEIRRVISDTHEQPVLCVAYNHKRRELFTGGKGSEIKLWDSDYGRLLRVLGEEFREKSSFKSSSKGTDKETVCRPHSGWITGLIWIPEDRVLVSCSVDNRIIFWNSKNIPCHEEKLGSPVHCIAWRKKKNLLIAGCNDGNVHFMELARDKNDVLVVSETIRRMSFRAHTDMVKGIQCSEGGKIFSVGYDRCMMVYDAEYYFDRKPRRIPPVKKTTGRGGAPTNQGGGVGVSSGTVSQPGGASTSSNLYHTGAICTIEYDSDNNWLITGSYDRKIKIWSMDGKPLHDIDGFTATVNGVAYCGATKSLWVTANSPYPVVYDPRTGANISKYLHSGGKSEWEFSDLTSLRESNEIVGITTSRDVVIWRFNPFASTRILRDHQDWIETLSFTEGKSTVEIFSGGVDRILRRWEVSNELSPDLYECVESYEGHRGTILCSHFISQADTGHEDLLCTGGEDALILVWQYAEAQKKLDLNDNLRYTLDLHEDRVSGLAHADHILISCSWDRSILFWDLHTGDLGDRIINAHHDYVLCIAYARGPDKVATGGADQLLKVWDFESKKLVCSMSGHTADVEQVAWNPVHMQWVSGADDNTIRVWSEDGISLNRIRTDVYHPAALCVDSHQGTIVAALTDKNIYVYHAESGEVLQKHSGHTDAVRCVVHVPNKQQYLSASWDCTIRVWNAYRPKGAAKVQRQVVEPGVQATDEKKNEERYIPYSEKHPLQVPKCLLEKENRGRLEFAEEESRTEKQKKKQREEEEAEARKMQIPVAVKLNELEKELRAQISDKTRDTHPPSVLGRDRAPIKRKLRK